MPSGKPPSPAAVVNAGMHHPCPVGSPARQDAPHRRIQSRAGVPVQPGYAAGVIALLLGLVSGTLVLLALRS